MMFQWLKRRKKPIPLDWDKETVRNIIVKISENYGDYQAFYAKALETGHIGPFMDWLSELTGDDFWRHSKMPPLSKKWWLSFDDFRIAFSINGNPGILPFGLMSENNIAFLSKKRSNLTFDVGIRHLQKHIDDDVQGWLDRPIRF